MRDPRLLLLAMLLVPANVAVLWAGPPRPYTDEKPLVVLLPEIEQLENPVDSVPAGKEAGIGSRVGSAAPPRQLFPNARYLFNRLKAANTTDHPTVAEQQESTAGQQVVPASETQSNLSGEETLEALPTLQLVAPTQADMYFEPASTCDEQPEEAQSASIAPRTHRPAPRVRFPHLSRMFAR